MTQRLKLIASVIVLTLVAATATLVARVTAGPETMQVTAFFSKTIGLFPAARVDVLGVAVGRVVSVTPAGNDVKVVMKIDKTQKIPADAHATIVPISLISDRYIQLFPPYQAGPALREGAMIGTDRTFIPAELDDLLSQLKKLLDALQTGTTEGTPAIGAVMKNLAEALRGTGGDLSGTLAGGGKLAATVLARSEDIDGIIEHLTALVNALAQRRNDLTLLNTRMAQALGAIAGERTSLGDALSNIDLLTSQLASIVHDHKSALETDVKTLAATTAAVIRHQDSLIRTLQWTPVLDDGVEAEHNGGAVHPTGTNGNSGPSHIDVRDSHFTTCPPGVPVGVCILLGLNGTPLSAPAIGSTAPSTASPKVTTPQTQAPAGSSEADLLDLLQNLPLLGGTDEVAPSSSVPGGPLGGMFDGLGGAVYHALRWFS
jgi:phospholipid/cholesterol/gamma-HCH transport system substrate-binding protein